MSVVASNIRLGELTCSLTCRMGITTKKAVVNMSGAEKPLDAVLSREGKRRDVRSLSKLISV